MIGKLVFMVIRTLRFGIFIIKTHVLIKALGLIHIKIVRHRGRIREAVPGSVIRRRSVIVISAVGPPVGEVNPLPIIEGINKTGRLREGRRVILVVQHCVRNRGTQPRDQGPAVQQSDMR